MYQEQSTYLIENTDIKYLSKLQNPIITAKRQIPGTLSGRWKEVEHKKFLTAIILYGNNWKSVHKYIKSRSPTQSRSHAQKFLLKLRKKLNIIPNYDSVNFSMRLSNESIQKIIQEIVENSSLKNTKIDKLKLLKLIIGFSNLLIGKSKFVSIDKNIYMTKFDPSSNYTIENEIIFRQEDLNRKVFLIEKTKRNHSNYSTKSNPISNHFLIEKNTKSEKELKRYKNEFSYKKDLLKMIFENKVQTLHPSNPDKNIINIISIRISNKNSDAESLIPENNSKFEFNRTLNDNLNVSNTDKINQIINNMSNDKNESVQKTVNCSNSIKWINDTTVDSPENDRVNFFSKEYYDDSSSFRFNPSVLDEEVDGFFSL